MKVPLVQDQCLQLPLPLNNRINILVILQKRRQQLCQMRRQII